MISLRFDRQMLLVALAALLGTLLTPLAAAQEKAPLTLRSDSGPVTEYATEPLLHEPSGRYFQFVSCKEVHCGNWATVSAAATRRYHKGRRGRLAKPDSWEVHSFLVSNFDIGKLTLTGLRYICPSRSLVWIDGEVLDSGFGIWDRTWSRTGDRCSHTSYMPVYYTANRRWQATDAGKGFRGYLVEYPPPSE